MTIDNEMMKYKNIGGNGRMTKGMRRKRKRDIRGRVALVNEENREWRMAEALHHR